MPTCNERRFGSLQPRSGGLPTWIVTAEARSVARLASALTGLDRVAVTSTSGSPEDVLFLANELVFAKGQKRRELRALYATPVAFRPQDSDADEYGFSYDASPGGLYVRSLLPCETDDVEVELRLPNLDDRVRLYGRVARRFAFGSGSIASAPPGFSVKLEGPAPALGDWAEACRALISGASDAFSDPPPRPRRASTPELAAVGAAQGGASVGLALPPASLTIESVVAPLPAEVLSAVDEGSDVGELLAATLDEQTLTNVGSRPIDPDTLGVREERLNELPAIPEDDDELAPETLPRRDRPAARTLMSEPAPRLPLPAPMVGAEPAPARDGGRRMTPVANRVLTPADWDGEDNEETIVRASRPDAESPPPPTMEAAPPTELSVATPVEFTAAEVRPATTPPGPPVAAGPPPEAPEAPHELQHEPPFEPEPPEHVDTPPLAPVTSPQLAPTVLNPPVAAKTLPLPAPTPEAWGPGQTMLLNPPEKRPLPPPERSRPQGSAGRGSIPDRELAPLGNPFGSPERVPASAPLNEPLPLPAPLPPPARPPQASAPALATAPALTAADAAPAAPATPAPPAGSKRAVAILVAAAVAVGLGVGAAVLVPGQKSSDPSAAADPAVVTPAERTAATPSPSPAQPTGTATVTAAASEAVATPSASAPAPTATATAANAAASSAPAPSATAQPTTAAAPGAVPAFDTTKLFADRAALFVHSSVDAHVFVHGTDYGPTNQMLVTSCGIRFVRLGRGPGDFLGPGASYVLKCRKVTELTIEPTR